MKKMIFPEPKQMEWTDSEHPLVPHLSVSHAQWKGAADVFASSFQKIYGVTLSEGNDGILLLEDSSLAENAYRIESDTSLRIYAAAPEGLRYALATALQLISGKNGHLQIPSVTLADHPDKDYRALMLDPARKFHTLQSLLKIVDLCFFYKIKYLHLHLIDDQSYTLPSVAFPKLPTPGKSYTRQEIDELNRYAAARGVILVPELESPGHATSLTVAYPEIFKNHIDSEGRAMYTENGDKIETDSLICAGSDTAMQAIDALIGELCEMFPDTPYIHIGGDEADFDAWEHCSVCREYMKKNGISSTGELYSDFTARMASIVLKHGRTPIVWEGFPKEGSERIPRETIVIAWESYYHQAKDLLDEGFRIINASWQPLYIVQSLVRRWYAKDILTWDVYNLQHWWKCSAACYNPIHLQPTDRVLGAQISSWGCTYEQEIGLIMENLAALSERTWNVERRSDLSDMLEAMEPLLSTAARLIQ